jgi:light-regulated signal transduction histidine kinase (bacteriophytochrome)
MFDAASQDMTHCYLRAMSPIHIKCKPLKEAMEYSLTLSADLGNMGVRASMSVVSRIDQHLCKIANRVGFSRSWDLVSCGVL